MTSPEEDVAQLLSSRTLTPIAQLHPDLDEQAIRTIHGEVTVTWPYSSITKSFAFLLAEPDVRLRRDKGLVRIHLTGPSANAVGNWELGSGDEVTLALDGVEWVKDDEPARLAGSRSDWQLRFAGKLTLKAFLSETQETKCVTIHQPDLVESPEASPIPFAETDHAIFDYETFIDQAPAPPAPAALADDSHPSPVYIKRSRASYGPMFDLDELEADSGRSSKRRKGLLYAAVNGKWTVRADNGSPSPEPEHVETSPADSQGQDSDVEMDNTRSRPQMADGGVQTQESDLAPASSSPIDTPSKTFRSPAPAARSPATSPNVLHQSSRPSAGAFGQPSIAVEALSEHQEPANTPSAVTAFGQPSGPSSFAQFGQPHGHSQSQVFGHASTLFGQNSTAVPANTGIGQGLSMFGHNHNPTATQANTGGPQGLSLFGASSSPAQPSFGQASSANMGFGVPSGSVRFGFGQTQSPPDTSAPKAPQPTTQRSVDPYPESSLIQQEVDSFAPVASQMSSSTTVDKPVHDLGLPYTRISQQELSLWAQNSDPNYAFGDLSANHSPQKTSSGMISPAVKHGTRDLYQPRQQGVPEEALSGQRPGDDYDSMDSEERAEVNHAFDSLGGNETPGWIRECNEMGEDDEEEELDPEEYDDEEGEEEYDEEDEEEYEEDDEDEVEQPSLPPPPRAIQPKIQEIITISDSEDEEPPPPVKAPRAQSGQQPDKPSKPEVAQFSNARFSKSEPEASPDNHEMQMSRNVAVHGPNQNHDEEDEDGDSGHDDEESSEEDSDSDEDMAAPGLEELTNATGYDLEQGSSDEESEAGEPQIQETITVRRMQLDGADDAVAVGDMERQKYIPESRGPLESETNEDVGKVNYAQLDGRGGDGNDGSHMSMDDDYQGTQTVRDQAEPEDQEETLDARETQDTQDPSIIDNTQLADADEEPLSPAKSDSSRPNQSDESSDASISIPEPAVVAHEAPPSVPAKSDSIQRNQSPDLEDATLRTPEPAIVADAMVVDDDSHHDAGESFQSQPDDLLASFQSHLVAATTLSQTTQSYDARDVEMKDDASQHESLSDGSESVVLLQDLEKDESKLSQEVTEHDSMDIRPDEEDVVLRKTWTVEVSMDDEQDEPQSSPTSQIHTGAHLDDQQDVDALRDDSDSVELEAQFASQFSDAEPIHQQRAPSELQDRDHVDDDKPEAIITSAEVEKIQESTTSPRDNEMTGVVGADEAEDGVQQSNLPQSPLASDVKPVNEAQDLNPSSATGEGPLPKDANVTSDPTDDESQRLFAHSEALTDDDEEFHDAPAVPSQADSPLAAPHEDSFTSTGSHIVDNQESEETEAPLTTPKRSARNARSANAKPVKSATTLKKGQRQASGPSYRRVSAQQVPSSQRRTRSKTMSFRAASPEGDTEDMSIQAALAALKSPESKSKPTQRKVSAPTKRTRMDLVRRLDNAMLDALPLKDLQKCINPQQKKSHPDFAAVVTSASTDPTRTQAREYHSIFTVTDPSFAPDGVVEVELFNKHKDFCPVVKVGDAILLRNFMVKALRDRGFGLTSRSATGSSWAVFKAGGEDEPDMKTPVEMKAKEKKFMLDLRSWYAGLDEADKGKLTAAAAAMGEAGKESKAKK